MSFDEKKLYTLLSPYKLKRVIKNTTITAGRFSSVELFKDEMFTVSPLQGEIEIGAFCQFASGVRFIMAEHENQQVMNIVLSPINLELKSKTNEIKALKHCKKITIGNNVVISHNCCILSGVSISDGAVIAAGSIVTKDIPPFSIAAGNPAKVIKYRFDEKTIKKLLDYRWWDLDYDFIRKNIKALYSSNMNDFISFLEKSKPLKYYTHHDSYLIVESNRDRQQFSIKDIYKNGKKIAINTNKIQMYFSKINDVIPIADPKVLY